MGYLSQYDMVDIFALWGTTSKELLDMRDHILATTNRMPCKIILPYRSIWGCKLEFGDVDKPTFVTEECGKL